MFYSFLGELAGSAKRGLEAGFAVFESFDEWKFDTERECSCFQVFGLAL